MTFAPVEESTSWVAVQGLPLTPTRKRVDAFGERRQRRPQVGRWRRDARRCRQATSSIGDAKKRLAGCFLASETRATDLRGPFWPEVRLRPGQAARLSTGAISGLGGSLSGDETGQSRPWSCMPPGSSPRLIYDKDNQVLWFDSGRHRSRPPPCRSPSSRAGQVPLPLNDFDHDLRPLTGHAPDSCRAFERTSAPRSRLKILVSTLCATSANLARSGGCVVRWPRWSREDWPGRFGLVSVVGVGAGMGRGALRRLLLGAADAVRRRRRRASCCSASSPAIRSR